jgi:hypothetical protein
VGLDRVFCLRLWESGFTKEGRAGGEQKARKNKARFQRRGGLNPIKPSYPNSKVGLVRPVILESKYKIPFLERTPSIPDTKSLLSDMKEVSYFIETED